MAHGTSISIARYPFHFDLAPASGCYSAGILAPCTFHGNFCSSSFVLLGIDHPRGHLHHQQPLFA
eukprot:6424211-Karenia_brevis.AAC.1